MTRPLQDNLFENQSSAIPDINKYFVENIGKYATIESQKRF